MKMVFLQKINQILNDFFWVEVIRILPRESTKFAKKYFGTKKINVVEIGILKGENSLSILKKLNVNKIYLIDPYMKYIDYKKDPNYLNLNDAKVISFKKLKKYSKNLIWVRDYSDKAIKQIKERVDFIYIDGNHEYGYVKKDLELYWKILNKGGILSGHDIQYHGVSRAVLEFAEKNKIKICFGDRRDWWIIKN